MDDLEYLIDGETIFIPADTQEEFEKDALENGLEFELISTTQETEEDTVVEQDFRTGSAEVADVEPVKDATFVPVDERPVPKTEVEELLFQDDADITEGMASKSEKSSSESRYKGLPLEERTALKGFQGNALLDEKTKKEVGVANAVITDVISNGDFIGENILNWDDEGQLTEEAIAQVTASLSADNRSAGFNPFNGNNLSEDDIAALVSTKVHTERNKVISEKNKKSIEYASKVEAKGIEGAVITQIVNNKWSKMNKSQRNLVEAIQNRAEATRSSEGKNSEERLALVEKIIELEQKEADAREAMEAGSTKLVNSFGERLSKPEAIAARLNDQPTFDVQEEIAQTKEQLPSDYEKIKSAWMYNAEETSELNRSLEKPFKVIGPSGLTMDLTLKSMAQSRATGTNFDEGYKIALTEEQKASEDLQEQLPSNRYLDNLNSKRRALNIEGLALDEMYLYNIDPASQDPEESSEFFNNAFTSTFGKGITKDAIGYTEQEVLKEQEDVLSNIGVELNEKQKQNFKVGLGMTFAQGTGAFVPELAKFFVANALTSGILGTVRTGKAALTWATQLNKMRKSKVWADRAKAFTARLLTEEVKFSGVTLGESKTGAGVGFQAGSEAFGKLIPYRFKGAKAAFNTAMEKVLFGGAGGATAAEVALVVENVYDAVTGDKDFNDLMKGSFVEDASGEDVDVFKRIAANFLTFAAVGSSKMKARDFQSIRKVRNLSLEYKGKLVGDNLSKRERESIEEKYGQTLSVLKWADYKYTKTNLGDLATERDLAQEYLSADPEQRNKFNFSSEVEAQEVITKYNRTNDIVTSKTNSELEKVVKSNILGNDFSYKVNTGEVDAKTKKGEYDPLNNTITINTGKFKGGVTEHEIQHAITQALLKSNPDLKIQLRSVVENTVSEKLKGELFVFKDPKTGEIENLEYGDWIDKKHEGKDDAYRADEYFGYLPEIMSTPKYRQKLIDTGIIADLKNSITDIQAMWGMKEGRTSNLDLSEGNLNRASDILNFYDFVASGRKNSKSYRTMFDVFKNIAVNPKNNKLISIPTGEVVESTAKSVKSMMDSQDMKAAETEFKNKNLEKINSEFDKLNKENMDPDTIGITIGSKFSDIANYTMESYLAKKGLNLDADMKYDMVADLLYEAIPKSIKTYLEGQRFIDYVKDNKLTKDDAQKEFKDRGLIETKGTERFERLFGYSQGVGKQAKITTYVLNNLSEKLIGVFQQSKYEGIFQNVSLDMPKLDALQETGGLPTADYGYIDTSSPTAEIKRTRKSAEAVLGLSDRTIKKVNETVDTIFKESVITDLDAKAMGTADFGSAGIYKVVMLEGNRARVTYPDGSVEIMLGARSPKPILEKINKKLKSEAFTKLRNPASTDAQKAEAQIKYNEFEGFSKKLPKYNKNDIFKAQIGKTIEKNIFEEMSKDAGGLGTAEWNDFVDKAYPLFKTYLSQNTINKRFGSFKEPLLGPDGKQARAKTAAGAPLFVKKNLTRAEWRKYFTGEGELELDLKRTSLLESLSRELGFDRVMESTIDVELRTQLENDQLFLSNKLADAYVALFQKAVNRGESGAGKMASDALEAYVKEGGYDFEKTKRLFNNILKDTEEINLEELKKTNPEGYKALDGLIKNYFKLSTAEYQKLGQEMPNEGIGNDILIEGIKTNFSRALSKYTIAEQQALGPVTKTFSDMVPTIVAAASKANNATVKSLLHQMGGYTRKMADDNQANRLLYEKTIKENEGFKVESSPEVIKSWENTVILLGKTLASGKNVQGVTDTFNKNMEAFIIEFKSIQMKPRLKGETDVQSLTRRINLLKNSEAGKNAINDMRFKDSLLQSTLLSVGEMYNSAPFGEKANVANFLGTMLMNNDGVGLRSMSSQMYYAFSPDAVRTKPANEHLEPKQKFGVSTMRALFNGDLMNPKAVRTLTSGYQSLYGTKALQEIGDGITGRVALLNKYTKIIAATSKGTKKDRQNVESMINGKLSLESVEKLKLIYNLTTEKSAFNELVSDVLLDYQSEIFTASPSAFAKNTKNFKTKAKLGTGEQLSEIINNSKKASEEIINEKDFYKEYIAAHKDIRSKDKNKTKESILDKGFDQPNNVNALPIFKGYDKATDVIATRYQKYKKGDVIYLLKADGITEGSNGYKTKAGHKPKASEIITITKDGQNVYEAFVNQAKSKTLSSDDIAAAELNSPEIALPRELAEMIERRGGAKVDEEVSNSKAYNAGKSKGNFELFLPANAEDFQGLLYKVYGKGKQGDADMAYMKENILRPYTRAENALSTYRMNLVVDYKALETKMKELGDSKAEVNSVKRVEKLGYNIDQAVRVYIWERLGKKVPGIQDGEKAQLVGAVHNSPRLQAYAKGIMEITKTSEQYPDPTANWFRSNVQYDLFTYATDGVRADFLAPWKANVDAMFTKENLNKLEARFGSKYVYNLKSIIKRMDRGKARPESTNEAFNKALDYVNGSVASIMFLNMRSAGLQTISAANYTNWSDNNPLKIGKVIAENPKLFFQTAKKIWSSDALKDRRTGLRINVEEAEMAKAINAGGRTDMQGLWDTMIKIGFKPTQMADSFAIVAGGTPFYMNRTRSYEKQGLNKSDAEAKAWEDFLDLTQESQQSSQMDRVSNIQTGLMGRLIFSFNNTPFQMSRLQKKATLDLINGRGDIKTNASKLGYYAFVQSTLFYGLQQGFYSTLMSDDDDKLTEKEKENKYRDFEKRVDKIGSSVFQGILTGSGLPGKVAVTAYNTVQKAIQQYDKGYAGKDFYPILNTALSISPTLGSKVSRLGRGWNSLVYHNFTKRGRAIQDTYNPYDPTNPNNTAYISMFGTLTNIPLDRIMQKMENIQGVLNSNNENWERVANFMGAPEWNLNTQEENKARMDKKLSDAYNTNTSSYQKRDAVLKDLKKDQQIDSLKKYGLNLKQIRLLKTEQQRIDRIKKFQDNENDNIPKRTTPATVKNRADSLK